MVMQLDASSVLSPPPTPPLDNLTNLESSLAPNPSDLVKMNISPKRSTTFSPQKPQRIHHKKQPPPPPPRSEQTRLESNHVKLLNLEDCAKTHETLKRNKNKGSFSKNAEDYFKGVSPMCRRLLDDMASVRESFGQDWENLTYEQQCKILDQAIVDEATVRLYEHSGGSNGGPQCEYFPKLQMHTGQNVIRDEKLSERGYTCTWRDEHSAPFSWHTRSQMDLTIDTPPETPMESQNSSSNALGSYALTNNSGDTTDGATNSSHATFTSHPQKKSHRSKRTHSSFTWHYDPSPKPFKSPSQDIPDVIITSDVKPMGKKSRHKRSVSQGGAHVIVKTDEVGEETSGFLGKLRGVFCKLTTSCLPMHPSTQGTPILSQSIPSETGSPPELRSAQVLAQANAASRGVGTTTPITTPISSSLTNQIANNNGFLSATTSTDIDLSAISPSSTTFSINDNDRNKMNSFNKYKKKPAPPPPIRKSSTTLSKAPLTSNDNFSVNLNELLKKQVIDEIKSNSVNLKTRTENEKEEAKPVEVVVQTDEDEPMFDLSTEKEEYIPKTGFDFLDNW